MQSLNVNQFQFDDYDFVKIDDVKIVEDSITMYDITVKDDHTYHIYFNGEHVLSHNCDGQHITGLIVNMFSQLWPGLIKKGLLYRLKTPVIVATHGKTFTEFFSRSEYNKWAEETGIKHSMKWYKGLGSWSTKDFKRFMQNSKYHEPLVYNDKSDIDCIDLAFDRKMADERKEWLAN